MQSRKRRVPEAVSAHRERKALLAASFAQRQSAALGRDARQQLKPLLDAPTSADESLPDLGSMSADTAKRLADYWPSGLQPVSSVFPPQPIQWIMPSASISFDIAPPTPTIDTKRLEALKNSEAYKPQVRVPDMVQVLTGWRGWKLKDGLLSALGVEAVWPAREVLRATCRNGSAENHLAPCWNCQCGIWAFKDLDRLVAAIGSAYTGIKVLGSVSLWGRVIEAENGYRAQYAYPSELWLLDESLEELGLIYDVPVRR